MYVTYQDLIQIGILIAALANLIPSRASYPDACIVLKKGSQERIPRMLASGWFIRFTREKRNSRHYHQ